MLWKSLEHGKKMLRTNQEVYDIQKTCVRDFSDGWKISLQGKSVDDACYLLDCLYDYLVKNEITFKVGTVKRFDMQDSDDWRAREQGRKALTIYCPNDMDIFDFCESVYTKIKHYQGWYDTRTPTSYKHYAGGVFYRNDRDKDGKYIKAN